MMDYKTCLCNASILFQSVKCAFKNNGENVRANMSIIALQWRVHGYFFNKDYSEDTGRVEMK